MLRRPAASPALRHAVRMTVAGLAASELTAYFGFPEGYWAVITALIVTQGSLGGTLGAALDRFLATMAGACLGVAGALLQAKLAVPASLVLVVVSAPLAILAAHRPSFRLAPVTAAMILMMSSSEGDALRTALDRLFEIALGCVIGVLTAQFVLPGRARPEILGNTAAVLDLYGSLARGHLTQQGDAAIEALNEQVRGRLARIATAASEESRERLVRLSPGPDAMPLLRTLRRLRSDVTILGRMVAVAGTEAMDHAPVAEALQALFAQRATLLRAGGDAPELGALDGIIGELPESETLHFALITLRRDLAELDDRLAELVAHRRTD